MAQFTPSTRAEVMDRLEDQDWVAEVQAQGPGLVAVCEDRRKPITGFTFLAERDGWYVDSVDTNYDTLVFVVMPFPDGGVE